MGLPGGADLRKGSGNMKYLSTIVSFLAGSAVTAGLFVTLAPPSSLDLGIELGRKLGLDAAEKRYANYEDGHEVLTVQAEGDKNRADAAESVLSDFKDRSYAEVARLKNLAQVASQSQEAAMQKQAGLQEELDLAWSSLELAAEGDDEATQKAVADAKMATQGIYNNLKKQLDFSLYENDSLRSQLVIKDREIVVLSASRDAWKALVDSEKKLREDAESYIADVKDSGFYVGIGGAAGYFKLASGHSGPGAGIALSTGWRF